MTKVIHEVDDQRLEDLLCNAFEGGSNYWYQIKKYNYPEGETKQSLGIEFQHLELPFKGGSITVAIPEENIPDVNLDMKAIQQGIRIMANKYPKHYADFISEDDDATTGDVFLQCCLFGEVIFS